MSDPRDYKPAAGSIPNSPGVYRFLNDLGEPLYVGKAKSLRNRLANYFAPLDSLHPRTRIMVTSATSLTWTVVSSDTEALLLEQSWINDFKPPYNVVFRDDKSFPYLALTMGDEAPRLISTRNTNIKFAEYFGPYPKVWAVRESMSLLYQAFPIRTCKNSDYTRAMRTNRPCLASQINKCFGPCSHKISIEDHYKNVKDLLKFLSGYDRNIINDLKNKMLLSSANHEYELAAQYRDKIQALDLILTKNAIVLLDRPDADIFGFVKDEISAAVHQFIVRGGRIRGERKWLVDIEIDADNELLLQQVVNTAYLNTTPPNRIVMPSFPEDHEILANFLSQKYNVKKIKFSVAKRGEKADLLEKANLNAKHYLEQYKLQKINDITARSAAIADLQKSLGLLNAPVRIECIDVSHLSGTDVVASVVVFNDAIPKKDDYRKYNIAETTDDTDSIYQVVSRRAARWALEYQTSQDAATVYAHPNLLIIDGAKAQVNAAVRALKEQNIKHIPVCGIAKRLEEIWLPDSDYPVILPRKSETLFLVQRIRDEAHRFAITHQRKQRNKTLYTQLDNISGLGPHRSKQLLRRFGSVAAIRKATLADIASVPGIGDVLANVVWNELHAEEIKIRNEDIISKNKHKY